MDSSLPSFASVADAAEAYAAETDAVAAVAEKTAQKIRAVPQKELKLALDPASRGELEEMLVDLSGIMGKIHSGPVDYAVWQSLMAMGGKTKDMKAKRRVA